MATAPEPPQLEKSKFPEAPWLGRLWDLLRPFFERTASALKSGLTHGSATDGYQPGNLLAFYREVSIPKAATYPISFRNELPGPAKGVVVWAVRLADSPNTAASIEGGAGFSPDWQNGSESGSRVVQIRRLTGLATDKAYVVTLAVYGG